MARDQRKRSDRHKLHYSTGFRRQFHPGYHGGSLFSFLKVRPSQGPPPSISQWLAKYGTLPIQGLIVCRQPISSVINAILRGILTPNAVPYDKLYHLWVHVHVGKPNDKSFHFNFEKNELVRVEQVDAFSPHQCADHLEVPIGPREPPLTLIQLFDHARRRVGDSQLWVYDPVTQNCQRFVWDLLSSSGLQSPQLEQFILQDLRSSLKGPAYSVARGVTNLASWARRLIGQGQKKGGYLRGGQDELERSLAMIPQPELGDYTQKLLSSLPDVSTLPLRPPTRDELQAAQALQARKEVTGTRPYLSDIPGAASVIGQKRQLRRIAEGKAIPPPVYEPEDELLTADFDEIADMLAEAPPGYYGDGYFRGGCAHCGGAQCAGVAGGCMCHGDKYGIGGYATPNAYLAGHHREPGYQVGGSFWTDIRDTFKKAFSKAGDVLQAIRPLPIIGAPLGTVGDVYKVISGGRRQKQRRRM